MNNAIQWLETGWERRHPYRMEYQESVCVSPMFELKDDDCPDWEWTRENVEDIETDCYCMPNMSNALSSLRVSRPMTDDEIELWLHVGTIPAPKREERVSDITVPSAWTGFQRHWLV